MIKNLLNKIVCSEASQYLKNLPDNSVDMTLTSPPYDNLRTYKGYTFDFENIANELYRVLSWGGVLVWVVNDATIKGSETLTSMRQALYFVDVCGFKMHDTMIWKKSGNVFNSPNRYSGVFEYMFVLSKGVPKTANMLKVETTGHGYSKMLGRKKDGSPVIGEIGKPLSEKIMENVWNIYAHGTNGTKDSIAYKHPARFPEELAQKHIHTWSNEGDIVLDPFMGSGTTAKMAMLMKRNFVGCDISQDYVNLANERLSMYADKDDNGD